MVPDTPARDAPPPEPAGRPRERRPPPTWCRPQAYVIGCDGRPAAPDPLYGSRRLRWWLTERPPRDQQLRATGEALIEVTVLAGMPLQLGSDRGFMAGHRPFEGPEMPDYRDQHLLVRRRRTIRPRRENLTSLLAALHHRAVRLYLPRHVLDELMRHIPEEAAARRKPVDPAVALERWNTLYAPYVRVVDVPADWARTDPRVHAVDMRHRTDTPTAQLAATLGPCWVLTEDPDLIDNEFGLHDRLPMLLAAANEGELRYVETAVAVPTVIGAATLSAASKGFTRLPVWAQVGLVAGSGFLVYYWHHDGRLANRLRQVLDVVTDLGRLAAPPLMTIVTRRQAGEAIWEDHLVAPIPGRTLTERVASVVARGPDGGLLARDVATHLDVAVAQAKLVPMVRDVLHASTAFIEVSRGRWVLGEPASEVPSAISPEMIVDWLHRSHRLDLLKRR